MSDKINIEKIINEIKYDISIIKERDPAAKNNLEIIMLYSGLHAVLAHRISHILYEKQLFFAARFVSQTSRFFTGIEIHPGAKIGRGLFIDHGTAVVIGETAEIGDNCTIYQGVTLGGTGKHVGKRHPTLGDNVMVGAGAKVLGPFKIGNNSKIASNAVVLEAIPENSTAVGIPARIVKRDNKRVDICDLDQVHIPDPVAQELCKLKIQIDKLERKITEIENKKEQEKN
ncbi:MAG: serine O-acetyltransferase EpsC [Eubacteriales bacterium]